MAFHSMCSYNPEVLRPLLILFHKLSGTKWNGDFSKDGSTGWNTKMSGGFSHSRVAKSPGWMETISWRGYVVAVVEMKKHPATSCPLTFLRSPKHIASVIRPPPVLRLPICRLRAKLFCCSHNPLSRLLLRLHGKLLGIEDKNQSVARPEIRDLRLIFSLLNGVLM